MAGMIAAEVLKTRGHNPVIFEASDKLAGQFRLAGVAPMKQDGQMLQNGKQKK